MAVYAAPVVTTVYWFDGEDATTLYREFKPYAAAATVLWLGPNRVHICALRGEMTRQRRREIETWLREQGVQKATFERNGRLVEAV